MLENLLLRPIFTFFLKLFFRVEIRGLEHYKAAGDKVVIIANHQSFIEPILLATFLPEKPAFALSIFQGNGAHFKLLDKLFTFYRLDPSKPLSMKHLIQDLRKGAKVVLFPEGRISTSGGIMKIYDGTGMIIEKTGATVLNVRVENADYSTFSRVGKKLRQRWFPKIRLTFMPPKRFAEGEKVSSQVIYDMMTQTAFRASNYRRSLLDALLEAYGWHGGGHTIATDIARTPMGYRALFTRVFILAEKLRKSLGDIRYVGVLLPNSQAVVVTFVSLHILGKVPCMLNFSAGVANIEHACKIATVQTVLTSRQFIEKAKLEDVVSALEKNHRIIYLEDIRPTVKTYDKLAGLYRALTARWTLAPVLARTKPDDPAVILYTSGSEGTPKGVALSHANILADIAQACARLDLTPSDLFFNALPVFHSFGLMAGMLLPLVRGIPTFLYPSPLHYRIIPDLVYDTDATIMLGTDTFYNGYARYANPYDFHSVRLAVAGAETKGNDPAAFYAFNMSIFEGYGVTEVSPVVAVNTPMEHKIGSVGRPLPDVECRLEKVEGLEKGGRLLVKGPNVMLGYLKANRPGVIQPQAEWYDTGDIVDIDEDGFIFILGRAKRFAKIAGEMVSLLAVEELVASLMPDVAHAAITIPDERKGEQIVLFTESKELTKEALLQYAQKNGVAEICLPKQMLFIDAIPRLGNGKIDYVTLAKKLES